jgi:hypothetical protein
VADYRIYLLEGSGHIISGSDACCPGDDDALALAKTMLKKGVTAEVWQGTRCVGQVAGLAVSAAPPEIPARAVRPGAAAQRPESPQSRPAE